LLGLATNLEIDQKLLARAVKLGGFRTKRETVNAALADYIRRREQQKSPTHLISTAMRTSKPTRGT
jgi:Arc/MetJ family transcription regulator